VIKCSVTLRLAGASCGRWEEVDDLWITATAAAASRSQAAVRTKYLTNKSQQDDETLQHFQAQFENFAGIKLTR
jgi:hypothetical protein